MDKPTFTMDIGQYKEIVIKLFRSGEMTITQYREMAEAVLLTSESDDADLVRTIDQLVDKEWNKRVLPTKEATKNGY